MKIILPLLSAFLISSNAFAKARQPSSSPAKETLELRQETAPEQNPEFATSGNAPRAVFLVIGKNDDIQKIIKFFQSNTNFKATLFFPKNYFNEAARRPYINELKTLRDQSQIEIGLTLDNEPILPLLADLAIGNRKWDIEFAWPEDIGAQVARGSAKYQKTWAALPAGFLPPFYKLSAKTIEILTRFRLNWVLAEPSDNWGIRFYGGMGVVVPPKPPIYDEATQLETEYAMSLAPWAVKRPIVLFDGSRFEAPDLTLKFLENFLKEVETSKTEVPFEIGTRFINSVNNEYALLPEFDLFSTDYSLWTTTAYQKRAWQALSDARRVLENYKNSGRASISKLDSAMEETNLSESSQFLIKEANKDSAAAALEEKTFLATIANIYRLCNYDVPSNLNNWFQTRTIQKATTARPTENDKPFFVQSSQKMTWNDPKADDNGSGKYTYPIGSYPHGFFDLNEFSYQWTDEKITFSFSIGNNVLEKPMSVAPMLDVYIDINRLSGAGSTSPLPNRRNTILNKESAWEYAVVLTPMIGQLYQSIPGSEPRIIKTETTQPINGTYTIEFELELFRGDPRRWRLSVGLLGTESSKKNDPLFPAPVSIRPSEKSFGGATNSNATPYIDILISSNEEQFDRFKENELGQMLNLPYVEAR